MDSGFLGGSSSSNGPVGVDLVDFHIDGIELCGQENVLPGLTQGKHLFPDLVVL